MPITNREKPSAKSATLMAAALALLTLATYWPVLHCDFINYDDPEYFTENAHVLRGLTWDNFLWAARTTENCSWYPITWFSFLLDVSIFGAGPLGPHLTNLLLHIANTILLFLLVRRLTATIWRSAFVAALFALHPLHVESVAWVAERKDVLSTFFGLLSLLAYTIHAQRAELANAGWLRRIACSRSWWLALVLFVAALLAKPMFVTLPAAMLLLDFWPMRRLHRSVIWRAIVEKIPFVVVSCVATVVTILVHKQAGAMTTLSSSPMLLRIENAFVSYVRYLGKMFWPADLALPYPRPESWPLTLALASVALFMGISLAAWLSRNRRPYVFVGWFWFVLLLSPVMGIIQWGNHSIADRFTYVPLVGLFIAITWGAVELASSYKPGKLILTLFAAFVLLACVIQTRRQLRFWESSEALFAQAVLVTKDNYVAYDKLGLALQHKNDFTRAEEAFAASLKIAPRYDPALADMARLKFERRDFPAAEMLLSQSLERHPNDALTHSDLAMALAAQGKTEEALPHYRESVRLQPNRAEVLNNLAWLLATHANASIRNGAESVMLAEHACSLTGETNFWMLSTLAAAYAEAGKFDDAVRAQKKVCELSTGSVSPEQAEIFQRRIELYRSKTPYHRP